MATETDSTAHSAHLYRCDDGT